jgi:hypothetical protein
VHRRLLCVGCQYSALWSLHHAVLGDKDPPRRMAFPRTAGGRVSTVHADLAMEGGVRARVLHQAVLRAAVAVGGGGPRERDTLTVRELQQLVLEDRQHLGGKFKPSGWS